MIILDTNILSELMSEVRNPAVVAWMARQERARLYTTVVNVFELRFGLSRIPLGRRREALESAYARFFALDFEGRVLPVDTEAADAAGRIAARRSLAGRPGDIRDTLIAGIAVSRGAVIATRNVRHFADLETGVVDPWAGAGI